MAEPQPIDRSSPTKVLIRALPKRRRGEIALVTVMVVISALLDIISIGAIVPFLTLLVDPALAGDSGWLSRIIGWLPQGEAGIGAAAFLFASIAIVAAIFRLILTRATERLSFGIAHDLNTASFAWLLRQDYSYYLKEHSGDVLARFEKISEVTFTIVLAGIEAVAASMIGLAIVAFLLAIAPPVVMLVVLVLLGLYLLAAVLMRGSLHRNSDIASEATTRLYRIVQQALGGIRDILLDRSQAAFERDFTLTSASASRAFASTSFISQAPRIVIEAFGIVAIAFLAWQLSRGPGGLVAAIPLLGALAIGAQRLLPIAQSAYRGWSSFAASRAQLADVTGMLGPVASDEAIADGEAKGVGVSLDQVSFAYDGCEPVLHDISFDIAPGDRIGIAGPSGAGKSTLVDLLLGFLEPSSGKLLVGGQPLTGPARTLWQSRCAHVPQEVYLSEASLAANIAFGSEEPNRDRRRIEQAARQAGIHDFIMSLPEGHDTLAGERGVRLSGGQRQRIAIARALYKQANFLVLDEATSALDAGTESAILNSIDALGRDMTVIIVSHRDAALARCDRVVRLEEGRIVESEPVRAAMGS